MRKSLIFKALLAIVLIVALAGVRQYLQVKDQEIEAEGKMPYAEMVRDNHPLLKEFRSRYPELTVLLACAEDITNDGVEDLVDFMRRRMREAGMSENDISAAGFGGGEDMVLDDEEEADDGTVNEDDADGGEGE